LYGYHDAAPMDTLYNGRSFARECYPHIGTTFHGVRTRGIIASSTFAIGTIIIAVITVVVLDIFHLRTHGRDAMVRHGAGTIGTAEYL